jgi:DNA-binding MarR family transcriptional regulator
MWARMAEELDTLGHDLTFSQYMTLKKLADGTAGVTDLARAVDLNPGAMTRLLDKLEAKGLIARVADAGDRRALNIHLTEAGLAIWQDINQCGMRVRERAMHGMSEAERDQLTRLITQVRDNLSPSGS